MLALPLLSSSKSHTLICCLITRYLCHSWPKKTWPSSLTKRCQRQSTNAAMSPCTSIKAAKSRKWRGGSTTALRGGESSTCPTASLVYHCGSARTEPRQAESDVCEDAPAQALPRGALDRGEAVQTLRQDAVGLRRAVLRGTLLGVRYVSGTLSSSCRLSVDTTRPLQDRASKEVRGLQLRL